MIETPPANETKPTPASWAFKAAGLAALLGAAVFVYWLLAASAKPDLSGYGSLRTGAMAALVMDPEAPPKSMAPLATETGAPASLAETNGKVTVLNLWATWCAPCVEEMPTLGALQKAMPEVVVYPVSVDRLADRAEAAAELAKLSGGVLPFRQDHSYKIAFDLKAKGFPTTIVYAKDGREIGRIAGAADWASPEAKALLQAALDE